MKSFHRASLFLAGLAIPLAPAIAQTGTSRKAEAALGAIDAAVAAPTRTAEKRTRDQYRHPAETLAFFGVTPGQTVIEYAPGGGGWYTEILAPLLRDKGTLYALQPAGPSVKAVETFLASNAVYDKVKLAPYTGDTSGIPAGSADTVLTFRNVHNMVMAGKEAETFGAFFAMLKPGGILGIVDHRLPEDRDGALEKSSGYLKTSTIRRIAEEAGFEYAGSSEVNANPKDSANWPGGVWTLPPTLRNGETDKAKYLAIGESDRMTLKFRKPTQ